MKSPLRFRYFLWMAALAVAYYAALALGLFIFNRYELTEPGHDPAEEFEEFLILLGIGAGLLPLVLLLAWDIAQRMLRPLSEMAGTATRISEGAFDERLPVPTEESELSLLARALNAAFERFSTSVRKLEQFTSDASHQLRNPLMGLRGSGEVVLQRERTPAEYRDAIGGMLEESARLSQMVEQLLACARLDAARLRMDFAPLEATALLREASHLRRAQAASKGQRLDIEDGPPAPLRGNRALLVEAIANLLDNAIRHAPPGSVIALRAAADAGGVALCVADPGSGIPEEQRAKLFTRFQRGDHSDPKGSGLGLAIVAEIAHLHGGSVEARNRPQGGAEFVLRLPPQIATPLVTKE